MKAKLKVPRRSSLKKDEQAAIAFKNTLNKLLKMACWLEYTTPNPAKNGVKYWSQDETRIGLKTIEEKELQLWELSQKVKFSGILKPSIYMGQLPRKQEKVFG